MARVALDESARLLVLGAGPAQLGVLAAARRRGLTVIAADRDPSAPGFRYADRRAIVSIEDEPAIDRLAKAERVDGIIAPGTDHAVAAAARIAARLALPHPMTPEAAVLAVLAASAAGAARRRRPRAAAVDRLPDDDRGDRRGRCARLPGRRRSAGPLPASGRSHWRRIAMRSSRPRPRRSRSRAASTASSRPSFPGAW